MSKSARGEAHLKALDGAIHDGKHVMQVRVYYEDTDLSDPPLL